MVKLKYKPPTYLLEQPKLDLIQTFLVHGKAEFLVPWMTQSMVMYLPPVVPLLRLVPLENLMRKE